MKWLKNKACHQYKDDMIFVFLKNMSEWKHI